MVVAVSQLGIVVLISAVVEIIGTRHSEFLARIQKRPRGCDRALVRNGRVNKIDLYNAIK